MEPNFVLWLKSIYDILIGKDSEWKFYPSFTSTTATTSTNDDNFDKQSLSSPSSLAISNDNKHVSLNRSSSFESELQPIDRNDCNKQDINNNNNNNVIDDDNDVIEKHKNNECHSSHSSTFKSYQCDTNNTSANNDNKIIMNNHSNCESIVVNNQYDSNHITKAIATTNDCDNLNNENNNNVDNNRNQKLFWSKFCSKPQSIQSNQFIQIMINAFCQCLPKHYDPLIIDDIHDHPFNSFVTVQTRQYRIYGLGNVTKTNENGYIKYVGNHKFIVNFIILLHNVKIQLDCQLKIGQRWHRKRLSMRNKTYEMNITKCRLYIELLIDSQEKSILFQRLSPISQEYSHPIHLKRNNNLNSSSKFKSSSSSSYSSSLNHQDSISSTATTSTNETTATTLTTTVPVTSTTTTQTSCHFLSFNHLFSTFIERNIKNYFICKLNRLENIIVTKQQNTNINNNNNNTNIDILNYDNLIVRTSLDKILNLFPSNTTNESNTII